MEKKWFESKRLWMALASLVLLVLSDVFGVDLDMEQVLGFVGIVLGYIFGESLRPSSKPGELEE